jgi:glycosyltransferase involved in cell wall biosynthesis
MKEPASNPLVSVIVATYNRASFLEKSLRSILDQSYRNIECIVMDGASKDNSVEILTRMAAVDPRLRFISEPDKGEVYATNKGIDLVCGDIVGFQASDDYYTPGAIESSVEFLLKNPQCAGVSGDALFVDKDGNYLGRGKATRRGRMAKDTIKEILIRHHYSPWNHGAFFGWRERIFKWGKLNPEFSVTPDYEFYLRLLEHGEEIGCLPRVQVHYTLHEDMGAVKYRGKVQQQQKIIYDRYGLNQFDHIRRLTTGKFYSWASNPYRPAFLPALVREIKGWVK